MFSLQLYVFLAALFLQGALGGWEEELLESHTSPVLKPLQEITQELEANLAELEVKKQELELHKKQLSEKLANIPKQCQSNGLQFHTSFFDKWDLDSCINLTDDWKVGADLSMQGFILFLNITETLGTIGNNILDCPTKSIFNVLPCYNTNLVNLKNEIFVIKDEIAPFIQQARTAASNMRKDFHHCLGISDLMKERIDRHIENIKC